MEYVEKGQKKLKQFIKSCVVFIGNSERPDQKESPCEELKTTALATGAGFLIMGFIGFFVKLIAIPVNNLLLGN